VKCSEVQVLGSESSFGAAAMPASGRPREAVLWMAVKHQDKKAIQLWAKEIAAAGTGGTPGITAVVGGRPSPSPCLTLYSFLYPKALMPATVSLAGAQETYTAESFSPEPTPALTPPTTTTAKGSSSARVNDLAFTRSGDKAWRL
jgi:hypothetical protein